MRPISFEPFRLSRAYVFSSVAILCFWRCSLCRGSKDKEGVSLPSSSPPLSEVRRFAAEFSPGTLNVHVVPHTHDDVGWLKTVDQYYGGLNNSIQQADVRSIITTVVQSLMNNPSRTFSYVEQKFFSMWWSEQSDAIKDQVRYLVASQQLVFLNGGWCMHDEASTHYVSMIDQTTLGHSFLLREFGVVPRVAWQLDPFGHSATQASLLTSRAGMDALYFGRIDYQDLSLRKVTRECEGLWNASGSLNDTTIFWGLTGSYNGNYGAPPGFWYDIHTGDKSLVDADAEYVKGKIRTLLEFLRIQSDQTKGNHIMLTMGSDFQYERAEYNFANLDILVGNVMTYQALGVIDVPTILPKYNRVNIFYSNPEYYTDCKYEEVKYQSPGINESGSSTSAAWSVKKDDFFPYADGPHNFWTGYFTSRTAFKRFERVASGFLMAARQVYALVVSDGTDTAIDEEPLTSIESSPLYALEDALGVSQHHDSVSGTAKQHVADDYSLRVQKGLDRAAKYFVQMIRKVMLESSDLTDLTYCPLLNESICEVSETATRNGDRAVYTIVYNPLATERSTIVRLPVSSKDSFEVSRLDEVGGRNGIPVVIQSVETVPTCSDCRKKHVLMFDTGVLPPVGAVAFRIAKAVSPVGTEGAAMARRGMFRVGSESAHEFLKVSNELVSASFDTSTGTIKSISSNNIEVSIDHEWGYYRSYDTAFDKSEVDDSGQRSGAYIFRPSEPEESLSLLAPSPGGAKIVNTSVGIEVHVAFNEPWMKQVTRVLNGQPFIEVEYTLGPIPIEDGRGKEVVTRYRSEIQSKGVFFTDSNGREFQRRQRNYRPTWDLSVYEPVAGNYYPVNAAIYLEDDEASLAVLVDRSQGGASLFDGTLELMVQRRIVADDGRGVDEALNETVGGTAPYPPYGDRRRLGEGVVIRGTHRILVSPSPKNGGIGGASLCRSTMDSVFGQPVVLIGSAPADQPVAFRRPTFSAIQQSLPPNVMLVTYARIPSRAVPTYLVRLAHQYGVGEDQDLSQPAEVDLASLFPQRTIVKVTEKTLSGNLDWSDYLERRRNWDGVESSLNEDFNTTTVVMTAMNIRTFEVSVQVALDATTSQYADSK